MKIILLQIVTVGFYDLLWLERNGRVLDYIHSRKSEGPSFACLFVAHLIFVASFLAALGLVRPSGTLFGLSPVARTFDVIVFPAFLFLVSLSVRKKKYRNLWTRISSLSTPRWGVLPLQSALNSIIRKRKSSGPESPQAIGRAWRYILNAVLSSVILFLWVLETNIVIHWSIPIELILLHIEWKLISVAPFIFRMLPVLNLVCIWGLCVLNTDLTGQRRKAV